MTIFRFTPLLVTLLLLGSAVLMEVGRRLGVRALARDPERVKAGVGAIEGAIFGLLGLLVAFTFSGAAARFDTRRNQIVEEANNIGTAYLRLDLLPAEVQPVLRDLFRRYLDARLEAYRVLPDEVAARAALQRSVALQGELWSGAVAASQGNQAATMLLLPALNQMIDITTTRLAARRTHPPLIIYLMLGLLVLIGALLAGHGMAGTKRRNWFHMLTFAAVMSATIYVIVDLEFPRLGLIQVSDFDQVLMDVRQSMK